MNYKPTKFCLKLFVVSIKCFKKANKQKGNNIIMSIFKNNLGKISWAHNLNNIFKYFEIYYNLTKYYKKNLPGFIYDLEYEKFVENPELESKKLFNFCEIPWDKKCLEFYKRKDLISKTTSNIQIRKAINKNSIKKYLPYKQFLSKYGDKYNWFY